MKLGGAFSVAIMAALFMPSEASAGSIKLVSGGPDKPGDKRRVISTLISAGARLSRCLRGHTQPVQVRVRVARSGRVRSSTSKVRNRAGYCVARVIRGKRFFYTRRNWVMVIELSPNAAAPGGATRRDMAGIGQDLSAARSRINACSRRFRVSGSIRLSFLITPAGRLVDPKVVTSSGVRSAARVCMIDVLRRYRVRAQPSARTITYRLGLSFDNRGSNSSARVRRPGKRLQPKSFGPLAGREILPVMSRKRAKFNRCYTKYARRKPGLRGDIVLRFTIRGNGTVRNVKIRKTTMKHRGVERCIVAVGKTLKFPGERGRGTTRVFYPFRF